MACAPESLFTKDIRSDFMLRRLFTIAVAVALLCHGCSKAGRDRFTLTDRDVDPKDLSPVGEGYASGFGRLGSYLNGHGLPDQRLTFLLVHTTASGNPELVWPDFAYGDDQANAAVLDGAVVFTATLPDHRTVLMAHHAGKPPMVISSAVLRLAVQRLGTSKIIPGTEYSFTKVRLPPGRIWLQISEVARAPGQIHLGSN